MLNVKAFMTINSLVTNDKGAVSKLGELSPISRTYSREIGEYVNSQFVDYRLSVFSSADASDNFAELSVDDAGFCMSVINAIVTYAKANIRPYNVTNMTLAIRQQHTATLKVLELGEFVDNGDFSLPEWVQLTHTITGSIYRIWLADQAFQQQYDQFAIEVIPYIQDLNVFFGTYGNLNSIVSGTSMSQFMERIQERRNKSPETVLDILQFNYVNRDNTTQQKSIPFGLLVYGLAGDNVDAKKDAIIDYLLANSDYDRAQWETIFPDIFKRVEFTCVPRWDKVAVPNLTNLSEIYANILDYNEIRNYALEQVTHYTAQYVQNNIEVLPHIYKNVMILVVAGDSNDQSNNQLRKLHPSYFPVANTSLDFGRMPLETREWSNFFFELVKAAETLTRYNTVPTSMRRIERSGKLYVTALHDGVNYLVAAKSNGN